MRKIAALGMIAITVAVNMTPVTAKAAGVSSYSQCYGGNKAVTISGNSLDELKSKLQEYGIDSADWIKSLGKQNCPLNSTQQDYNVNTNPTPYVSDNNAQVPETMQNPQVLQNEADCSRQEESVSTPTDTTRAGNIQENTTVENKTANKTTATEKKVVETTNTNISKPDVSKKTTNETTKKTTTSKETNTNASYIQQVVNLVNVERSKAGLAPLTIDKKVEQAAMVRAREIQTKFDHVRPDGSGFVTALKEQGAVYRGAGENIAWGQRTPEEVVAGWMNSPGHRANIMNKNYVNIGVGNLQNSAGTQYWVQIFTY
jgi:uncharacterized protein YkwD